MMQQWKPEAQWSTVVNACAVIGAGWLALKSLQGALFLKHNYLSGYDLAKKYKHAGSWAVVSGGSEGIGYAMALDLARRGFSVVLIALDEPRLYEAAASIERTYPSIKAKAIPFDFLAADDDAYQRLWSKLSPLDVAVLVNNVGGFYRYPKPLEGANISEDLRLIRLNCEPQVRLTKLLIPHFKAKRCGAIVSLSSYSARVPSPYMATYAATKAFNFALSRSLEAELQEFGIDMLAVTPFFVSTRITQGVGAAPMPVGEHGTVCPKEMARHTLNKLGVVSITCGHNTHEWFSGTFPLWGWAAPYVFLAKVQEKYREGVAAEAAAKSTAPSASA